MLAVEVARGFAVAHGNADRTFFEAAAEDEAEAARLENQYEAEKLSHEARAKFRFD